MTIDTQQEALDALADAALGTDSPSEAFIQGYLAGRTAEATDEEITFLAQLLVSDVYDNESRRWESLSEDMQSEFESAAYAMLNGLHRLVRK